MFEALLTLCLPDTPHLCRDVLLPGYEAQEFDVCQRHVSGAPIDWSRRFPHYLSTYVPRCAPQKPPAAFQQIAEGVYVHRGIINDAAPDNLGDVANLSFIVGADSVAIIDAGGSRLVGENLFRAVRSVTDKPINHVILTHMHPDHVLGASVFTDLGAKLVGHHRLIAALAELGPIWLRNFGARIGAGAFIATEVSSPYTGVSDTFEIALGDRVLALQAWPKAHTETDLTIHDLRSGILFTGDLIFVEHAPALDGSVTGWHKVLEQLQGLPVRRIVPGHGGPVLDWPKAADALSRYLSVLEHDTRRAVYEGLSLHEAMQKVAASEKDQWQLFDLFHPRNVTRAYTELEWE